MENHSHAATGMRIMYMVWASLLGLTLVEVILAYLHVPLHVMLVILLGISLVKTVLIVSYFMHLKFERLSLVITLIPALVGCILLMNIIFPDSIRLRKNRVFRDLAPTLAGHQEEPEGGE
ncbi:MAG: cytochrome C oxidase subunit IV family protein [Acidobacteriota bacterium]